MPVRSSTSPVIIWPDRARVESALERWVDEARPAHPTLRRLGFFGSYARGTWGVGSDLDVVVVVAASDTPRRDRAMEWDLTSLPVPVDLLVYTEQEWNAALLQNTGFAKRLREETVWVFDAAASAASPTPPPEAQ